MNDAPESKPAAPAQRGAVLRTVMVVLAGVVIALALGLVGRALILDPNGGGGRGAGVTGEALIGGPFTLTDQNGNRVSDTQFRGKLMLVYFGYTYCPDVCPTTLLDMSQAMDTLGAAADQVQPIFITVDPERDTPGVMKDYLTNFHPRLIGLTGTPAEIQAAAKAYRVYYAKAYGVPYAKAKGDGKDYLMDHSSIVYLMDRQGRYLAHFGPNIRGPAMAETIRKYL